MAKGALWFSCALQNRGSFSFNATALHSSAALESVDTFLLIVAFGSEFTLEVVMVEIDFEVSLIFPAKNATPYISKTDKKNSPNEKAAFFSKFVVPFFAL